MTGFELGPRRGGGGADHARARSRCEVAVARPGAVGGADLGDARQRRRGRGRARRRPASAGRWSPTGRRRRASSSSRRGGRRGPRGPRAAGRPPRPVGAAALRPRRRVLAAGPVGDLLPHRSRRGRRSPAAGFRCCSRIPTLDPYGPDNPAHAAEPGFAEFFTSGLAAAIGRFRGRVGRVAGDPRRRDRLPHPRQLPGLRLGAPERLRDRRLRPRLQDAGPRPPGRRRRARAANPGSSRSGSPASSAARPTRPRRGPYPWT